MRPSRPSDRLALGALLGTLAACGGGEAPRGNGTNVLLISLDSTRQDLLGAYGRRPEHAPEERTSPNLDRLAEEGVLFEDAYATTSWTLPSHATLFTGEPELVHGVELDGHRLHAKLPTIAERLAASGYRTAGYASGPYLAPAFGLDRGFERYVMAYGPGLAAAAEESARTAEELADADDPIALRAALERNSRALIELQAASHRDRSSEIVTDAALEELVAAAADERPFFLFAHYFDPHYDYVAPEPFASRFDPEYDGPIAGEDVYHNPEVATFDPSSPSGRRRVLGERDLEHVLAAYEAELAWTDDQVGRLLDCLDELGLAGTTLVVVLSDHGDEFFEHGGLGHRRTLKEEVVRVPLIMRLRGVLPAGTRVSGPVSLEDVAPTILDLTGLPSDARSLVPTIRSGTSERSVLGRLVLTTPHSIELPTTGDPVTVPGQLVHVLETFRKGPVKITRTRRWPVPDSEPVGRAAEWIEREAREAFADETLTWIDVEEHPLEPDEELRTDFSEPRARAALTEFREHQRARVSRRRPGEFAETTEDVLAALRGLGYTGQEARNGALDGERLVLPPPGEDVLGEESR